MLSFSSLGTLLAVLSNLTLQWQTNIMLQQRRIQNKPWYKWSSAVERAAWRLNLITTLWHFWMIIKVTRMVIKKKSWCENCDLELLALSPSSPGTPGDPAGPGRPTGPCTPSRPAGPIGPFSPWTGEKRQRGESIVEFLWVYVQWLCKLLNIRQNSQEYSQELPSLQQVQEAPEGLVYQEVQQVQRYQIVPSHQETPEKVQCH